MAYYSETDNYDEGLRQIETSDQAIGGTTGALATIFKSIANRTLYLKTQLDNQIGIVAKGKVSDIEIALGTVEITITIGKTLANTNYAVLFSVKGKSPFTGGAIINTLKDAAAVHYRDATTTTFVMSIKQILDGGEFPGLVDVSWFIVML